MPLTERDRLREEIARIICRACHVRRYGEDQWREGELDRKVESLWPQWLEEADAILARLDAMGMVVVPRGLLEHCEDVIERLDRALPQVGTHDDSAELALGQIRAMISAKG